MPDSLSKLQRSVAMSRVRRRDTDIELRLRHELWKAGLRYRVRYTELVPGSPDIIFPKKKIAVFVDGCFWHGCELHGTQPKTNAEFWRKKIERNRVRDSDVDRRLLADGWRVIRIWEHEIKQDLTSAVQRVVETFAR